MKRGIIIKTLTLAAVHLVLVFGSVIVSGNAISEAFDNPDYELSVVPRAVCPETNRSQHSICEIENE